MCVCDLVCTIRACVICSTCACDNVSVSPLTLEEKKHDSMYLEVFVVATSLALVCCLLFLTAVTQLHVHSETRDGAATLASFRAMLAFRLSGNRKSRRAAKKGVCISHSGTVTARDGRSPGKKARRTERRRQKRALVELHNHH